MRRTVNAIRSALALWLVSKALDAAPAEEKVIFADGALLIARLIRAKYHGEKSGVRS
jgi:hypothetical protein